MSKFLRTSLAALLALAGAVVFSPGVAHASFGPDMEFTMGSTVTVGDTGLPASITLTNGSDGDEEGFTAIICNQGDNPPCLDPGGAPPDDDIGINLILSCGQFGSSTTCAAADPGVFRPSPTGTGRDGTECAGTIFDIVDYNPAFGALRFTPRTGNVLLADPGDGCIIDFTVDVVGYPSIDRSGAPGQQTGQLGDVLAYSDTQGQLPGEASDTRDITVERAQPEIETFASPAVALGAGTITDRATVFARAFPDATASVQFDLYGPDDEQCANPPVFTSTVPISATDTQATSEPHTPTAVGTYRWIATYLGDSNNNIAAGECNDANESVVVTPGQPTLATNASDDIRLGGGTLTDTATVAGRVGPLDGATVDFRLYGPDNADCSGDPIFESLGVAISTTSDEVTSAAFTPTVPGTYRWIAEYSGDANNFGAAGECNDPNESTVVDRAQPEITTDAGDDIAIGGSLSDKATVTGRVSPLASTVDFRLYGPDDGDCSGTPVFEALGLALAPGDTMVTSPSFTPETAGTYRWIAAYSGDANNEPAIGECGDPAETVDVLEGNPVITTRASAGIAVGAGVLFDRATVTGRVLPQPGATIDFRLYGPGDTTCSNPPVFESRVNYPVAGGEVRSASFTPTTAGVYRWVATYSGDANNASAVGVCGDPLETVEVVLNPDVELPATGAETDVLLRTGGGLLLAGLAMFGLGTRRRHPTLGS